MLSGQVITYRIFGEHKDAEGATSFIGMLILKMSRILAYSFPLPAFSSHPNISNSLS